MTPQVPEDVCNLALDRLGQAPISSIASPQSPQEYICARWYDQTRRKLLRDYIFNFARQPVVLTLGSGYPVDPDFANAYPLPSDFIRLLTIGDRILYGGNVPTQFFTLSGNWLYCDENTAQNVDSDDAPVGGLQIEYVKDFQTVPLMDPLFIDVLHLDMAKSMASKFKPTKAAWDILMAEWQIATSKAAAISGQEKPTRRVQRSRIKDVRRSGGIFTDNTRY